VGEQPVIVVGSGPVGLSTALALNSFSIPVSVIEASKEDDIRAGSRALFLHNDSLCLLNRFSEDLGTRISDYGIQWEARETIYRNRCVYSSDIDIGKKINGLPTFTSLRQPDTEKILREACARENIPISWGSEVTGVVSFLNEVSVETKTSNLKASYVVAADGARSKVRKSVGLTMEGSTAAGQHIVVDFKCGSNTSKLKKRTFHYYHPDLDGRHVLFIPFAGGWQVDLQCRHDDDVELMASSEGIKSWLLNVVTKKDIDNITWISVYRFNQVVAKNFSDVNNRVILVGEAAHLFPPYGARGLNSGIADADVASTAVALARQTVSEYRRSQVIKDYARVRRAAALNNCKAAKGALRAIRSPTLYDKLKQRMAVRVCDFWEPAARWLDAAPYGSVWRDARFISRY